MKLSFVIPAYNEEAYVGKCLDSIVRETRALPKSEVEIIVVNNASTDRTKEIASSYKEVHVVDEARKGLLWARQAGFFASRGELIANIDADIMLPQGWLEKVRKEFRDHPNLVALSGPQEHYDLPRATKILVQLFYRAVYVNYLIHRYMLRTSSFIQGGNFVVRRTALQAIGGFNTSLNFYGEDADLARRLHRVGAVKFTLALAAAASGRRLAQEGFLTMALRYAVNYFWIVMFKKPFTKHAKDIRHPAASHITYAPENKLREFMIGFTVLMLLGTVMTTGIFAIYRTMMDGEKSFLAFTRIEKPVKTLGEKIRVLNTSLRTR